MRARTRYLGLPGESRPTSDEDALPLERVSFAREARQQLRRQLGITGKPRGGLLFGRTHGGVLHVLFACPPGYPWWSLQDSPLEPDQRYALGWSDCIETLHGGRVDWAGNWLAYPNGLLGEVRDDLAWLERGTRQGLFDDAHPLVVVGWRDGSLTGRAYSHDAGEPRQLGCDLGEAPRLQDRGDDVLDPRD